MITQIRISNFKAIRDSSLDLMTFRILVVAEGEHELGDHSDNSALIVLLKSNL